MWLSIGDMKSGVRLKISGEKKMGCGTRWKHRKRSTFIATFVSRTMAVDLFIVVSTIVSLMCWALGAVSGAALAQSEDSRWVETKNPDYRALITFGEAQVQGQD